MMTTQGIHVYGALRTRIRVMTKSEPLIYNGLGLINKTDQATMPPMNYGNQVEIYF
jgi:hypothetical protein